MDSHGLVDKRRHVGQSRSGGQGVTLDSHGLVDKRGHVGQSRSGGQEGSRWTVTVWWTRGVTLDSHGLED